MNQENRIILFQETEIRRAWHNEEWWFVVTDVITVLTDSVNPSDYIKKMRLRDPELGKGWGQFVTPLSVPTKGGAQKLNCANTEGLLRIIMAVPSPKAEPFKLWLARVGKERMDEVENPELAAERARELYRAKGYPEEWIEMRLQSIEVRQQLTEEWKNRNVREGLEYSILTAEIARATFGLTPTEHKEVKSLQKENLRDHMTNLELIFTMLGEESTRHIAVTQDAVGFEENKEAARKGGKIAGNARRELEAETGEEVVSPKNFKKVLQETQENKKLRPGTEDPF